MESNITVVCKDKDVTITLFLTDEDIKKYEWDVDTPVHTYEGYWWRNDLQRTENTECQKVDGGYQWTYSTKYNKWAWFPLEDTCVYHISGETNLQGNCVLYMDVERFNKEHPQEDKLFRYEAHQTYSTSGYVVASCQQEAERIVQAALCDGLYTDDVLEFDDFEFTDLDSRVEPAEGAITLSEYSCILKRPLGAE